MEKRGSMYLHYEILNHGKTKDTWENRRKNLRASKLSPDRLPLTKADIS